MSYAESPKILRRTSTDLVLDDIVIPISKCNVNILALDFGTYCGWAINDRDGRMSYGTEHFMQRNKWHPGQRWTNFRTWLSKLLHERQISVVYFEDVKRHAGTLAAHAYGGFLAMAQMVCQLHNVRMVGVGVGTVKQRWTGKGNAGKDAMIAEARRRGFCVGLDEDDTADALAVLSYAQQEESR